MKRIVVVLVSLLLAGIVYGVFLYTKKVPTLEDITADYVLTADELFDAFDKDEQAAMQKYEGKVIELSGEVSRFTSSDTLSSITLIAQNSMFGGVNCSFNSQITNVKKGDLLKLKGRCQGFLMDVVLNNCYLINE